MKSMACCMLISTLCMAAGSAPVAAQSALAQRYPLSREAVVRALHNDGLDVQTAELRMPMMLSTTVSNPALEVVGADRLPDGHLRLRMRCRHTGECLPFSITLTHSVAVPVLLASTLPPTASAGAGASSIASALPNVTTESTIAATESMAPSTEPVFVRAGARLTMLLDDGHMHIHLPVISLDSAAGNQQLRVETPDRKHTYRATVVNATTVRGIME